MQSTRRADGRGHSIFHTLTVVMARSFKLGLWIGLLDLNSDCFPRVDLYISRYSLNRVGYNLRNYSL
jgi:hypothetical protein